MHADEPSTVEPEPPLQRYRRPATPIVWIRDLWNVRSLVLALTVRELRVRYKHTLLGVLWALLVPLSFLVIFDLVFTRIATVDTGGQPYAVFAYIGLVVWTLFSTAVSSAGQCLLTNNQLINRVACPREIFPISSVMLAGVDASIGVVAFLVLALVTGASLHLDVTGAASLLVLTALLVGWTTAVSLVVAAAVVYWRDVRHLLPIALQLGVIATPIAYSIDAISQPWRSWYSFLNPLGPIIDGARRVLLQGVSPQWDLVGLAAVSTMLALVGGYLLFKRLEVGFADIA